MTFCVFGYGSLVNRGSLPAFVSARPGRARGWRRAWRAASETAAGGVCALSVVEAPGAVIEGLFVTFEDALRPVIDTREARYDPLAVCDDDGGTAIIFRARPESDRFGDAANPVHLSYVDCVLQGYLREFGPDGVARFMETTEGWHVPLLDDRAAPRYPRAQQLSADERKLVDRMLILVDAHVLSEQDGTPPHESW